MAAGATAAAEATAALNHDNTSSWHITLQDLLLAGPWMLGKLGSLLSIPDAITHFGQRFIPEPTSADYLMTTTATWTIRTTGTTPASGSMVKTAAAAATSAAVGNGQDEHARYQYTFVGVARSLRKLFNYVTSRWALGSIVMAIMLNRVDALATSRRRVQLCWKIRLALRLLPIVSLLWQARGLLQSIQCQTATDFSEMEPGEDEKNWDAKLTQPGGYLHSVSSMMLLGASDYKSCLAAKMVATIKGGSQPEGRGSLSRLWPLFVNLCFSKLIDTIVSAAQGHPSVLDSGLTLFETSVAFAETDCNANKHLGWVLWATKADVEGQGTSTSYRKMPRAKFGRLVNAPPETLLVAFLSAMSHVTSQILGIFGLQSRLRLLNTGFWALCLMGSISWDALDLFEDSSVMGFIRYPLVSVVTTIPYLLALASICFCAVIYVISLLLAALGRPEGEADPDRRRRQLTFRERVARAHPHMEAYITLRNLRVSHTMDFYTALLNVGMSVMTMTSQAVFLNQDRDVTVRQYTWLEEDVFRELDALQAQINSTYDGPPDDAVGTMTLVPVREDQLSARSGYARERVGQEVPKSQRVNKRTGEGIGAADRCPRYILALELLKNINRLVLRWAALLLLKSLAAVGVGPQSRLLLRLFRRPPTDVVDGAQGTVVEAPLDTYNPRRSAREVVDVAAYLRRRLRRSPKTATMSEASIESYIYADWKEGALWSGVDTSGDWEPEGTDDSDSSDDDRDTSTDEDAAEGGKDDEDNDDGQDGQRTPKQTPFASPKTATPVAREITPLDMPFECSDLARLLQPSTPEVRELNQTLAAHLLSDGVVTRAQYKCMRRSGRQSECIKLITAGHARTHDLSAEEEAQLLEKLILSRRTGGKRQSVVAGSDSWSGLCVVCHDQARDTILWPCRCLCICGQCRVELAMNSFAKCVCCNRDVLSYSRIYVP